MSEPVIDTPGAPASDEIVDRYFRERIGWVQLIKDLRATLGLSLHEAQKMALSHDGWRRWVEQRMKIDPQCRRQALADIRWNGATSLIGRRGDQLVVR